MKILAIERDNPNTTSAEFNPHLKAEAARAWDLFQQGFLRELYFRVDEQTAVLVLECADLAQADSLLGTLPLVQAGLITFELWPLAPYSGFARLFVKEP